MTNTNNSLKFFDEEITPFYSRVGNEYIRSFRRGQIFRTHIHYNDEDIKFWRPKDYDDTKTSASEFVIYSSPGDAFKRNTPLYSPKLEINEEFPVIRSKERPVILIAPVSERIAIGNIRSGGKINLNLCIVAPLYSVVDKYGKAKYPDKFLDRVRKLEFPNIFFVPKKSSEGIRESICRLDRFQGCFYNQMRPLNLCLNDEVLKVFKGQIEFYLTERYGDDYKIYRELLLSPTVTSF